VIGGVNSVKNGGVPKMIRFLKGFSPTDFEFGKCKIKKGEEVLEIFFDKRDIQVGTQGRAYLLVRKAELKSLKEMLQNENRQTNFAGISARRRL